MAYFSTKFSKPKKIYCVTHKELAAVMKSLGHFHQFLYGPQGSQQAVEERPGTWSWLL